MKKIFIVLSILIAFCVGQDMIVRVYVPSWKDLGRISEKPQNLDIAAGQYGEWYDLVVDREGLDRVIASGLPYEVTIYSLESEKEKIRGSYLSYSEINDSLRNFATNYTSICKFDSLPNTTYEGRWIYGVKISDNVNLEEDDEPGFTIDGCHHSREWATPQAVLFFADSMLRSYGEVSEITDIIDSTELYCFPLINVDGYVFDYPGQEWWRKNREPFGGYIGTDPNRNYGGACNGEIDGYWGAADESQVAHHPSYETFCGACAFCGDEIWAYTTYIREHEITMGFSLHSYGEQVMYPWGYKGTGTPDATVYDAKGNYMAGMMECLPAGSGTYTPGQSYYNPYPSCGNTRDWVYGYNKWVAGLPALFYGAEIGDAFYEPQGNLDHISRQVFKAAKYLAGFADSLDLITDGFVPPPIIYPLDTVGENFTVYWHAKNSAANNPIQWELVELSTPSIIEDDLESDLDRWILEGFTLSTTQHHSGTHSLFSGNIDDMNHAVRTSHPYVVQLGDSLTFWCWYDLETNWDVAVVEVSENTKEWFCADTARFNGNSGGWVRKAYSLEDWVGTSVYIRFRSMTDGNTLRNGFYVDDIYPVCLFETVDTVSSSISDSLYSFTGHPEGEYYYYVRGYNSMYGWGDYSCLEKTDVVTGIAEHEIPDVDQTAPFLVVSPNPFRQNTQIRFMMQDTRYMIEEITLKIYDISGKLVKDFLLSTDYYLLSTSIEWDGTDHLDRKVPTGIYFVRLEAGDYKKVEKVTLIK
jgi:hypothetical protein